MLLALLLAGIVTVLAGGNNSFTGPSGVFYSYNYPQNYDNDQHYFITVTVDPGYHIYITLLDFYTEPCCDKLFIWDGTSMQKTVANLSSAQTGDVFYSMSNQVVFEFYSDPTENYRGFAIKWEQTTSSNGIQMTNTCPPDLETSDTGFITSPNWPGNYPNNVECSYKLQSTKNRVQIKFIVFSTEACCDKVNLYDGDNPSAPLIASLFGHSLTNTTFLSSGPYMCVDFYTDITNNDTGFSAYYVSVT